MIDVEERLRAWGGQYRQTRDPGEDRSLTGNSSISRFGRPREGLEHAVGRSGVSRRRFMARDLLYRILPAWAVDPVSSKATRTYRADDDPRGTADVTRVQALWLILNRQQPDAGQVLRAHYQVLGKRPDRCQAASTALERTLTMRQYDYLLKQARRWMAARL